MFEITYYSLARPGLSSQDISNILKTAREFNAKEGLTGCLLSYKDQFIQVLEGEKAIVTQLLNRIKQDPRHSNLFVMAESEKEARSFADWTMAYHELSDDEAKNMDEKLFVNNILSFSVLADKPTYTLKTFWTRVQRLLTDDYTS